MPEELAKEYGPSGQSIRNWVREASREDDARTDEMTTAEQEELSRLRKENRQLRYVSGVREDLQTAPGETLRRICR
ncbi:transposase [Parafrankia discariae]|uniref:transposase n=1 Tax=Parafrankia discariae TaxID=365528 RepID=UPI0012B68C16